MNLRELFLYKNFGPQGSGGGGSFGDTEANEAHQLIKGLKFRQDLPSISIDVAKLFPYVDDVKEAFAYSQQVKEINIKLGKVQNFQYFCYQCKNLEKITIEADFSHVSLNMVGTFGYCNNLKIIDGVLPLKTASTSNNYNPFFNCGKLEEVRFIPNSSANTVSFTWTSVASADTLVSLANGLTAGEGTLTLHATTKENCNTIMGTVSNNGEYDMFTADAAGDTALTEFITTVKGWTLA